MQALFTIAKVLLRQPFPFLLNRIFHLFKGADSVTALTNPNFDEAPEVFNGVEVGGLCRPNHA